MEHLFKKTLALINKAAGITVSQWYDGKRYNLIDNTYPELVVIEVQPHEVKVELNSKIVFLDKNDGVICIIEAAIHNRQNELLELSKKRFLSL